MWEGLGMDKDMGFVMFVASNKYGNAYPAFHKEYGFAYHLTHKILKEIIACHPLDCELLNISGVE